jgi:LmbE family N-acetylglucosaminyl deacetylase
MRSKGLFNKPLLTEEQYLQRKRKHRNRRIVVYGSLVAVFYAAFLWIPWNLDIVEKKPAQPLPAVDPDSAKLFAKGTRILLVTAHPDDSEFYIGGTLLKLSKSANVDQVICTDGDKSFYWIFTNVEENRRVRHQEATQANQTWKGHSLTFLGYPDGRLRDNDELENRILAKIREIQPDYIMSFDPEYPPRVSHSDHRRAGEATLAAARKAGIGQWLMMFSTNAPNYISDVTEVWDARLKLLGIHKSQWTGQRLERVSNMISEHAIDEAGLAKDAQYGEGFRCVRIADLTR